MTLTSDNIYITTLINTLLVPLTIVIFGILVNAVATAITSLIAMLLGGRAAFFIRNRLTYVGTVHHELAHALFAFVTGAEVNKITLRIKGNTLGSVKFTPRGNFVFRGIQKTMAAIAPVVCGSISLYLMWRYAFGYCQVWWQLAIFYYAAISILFHMTMSPADIRSALQGLPVCLVIIYILFYITKWNYWGWLTNYWNMTVGPILSGLANFSV